NPIDGKRHAKRFALRTHAVCLPEETQWLSCRDSPSVQYERQCVRELAWRGVSGARGEHQEIRDADASNRGRGPNAIPRTSGRLGLAIEELDAHQHRTPERSRRQQATRVSLRRRRALRRTNRGGFHHGGEETHLQRSLGEGSVIVRIV